MNEGPNLHKSAFSLSFSVFLQHFLLVRMVGAVFHSNFFYAIRCNYVHHKPLLERENCELQHIKEEMG